MSMAKDTIKQDLEMLSAKAHTAESFGRAILAGSLAAAAKEIDAAGGQSITLRLDVTITRIPKVGAYVCVGIPGMGRFCRLERDDTP
jgi:hypothetical protein